MKFLFIVLDILSVCFVFWFKYLYSLWFIMFFFIVFFRVMFWFFLLFKIEFILYFFNLIIILLLFLNFLKLKEFDGRNFLFF